MLSITTRNGADTVEVVIMQASFICEIQISLLHRTPSTTTILLEQAQLCKEFLMTADWHL